MEYKVTLPDGRQIKIGSPEGKALSPQQVEHEALTWSRINPAAPKTTAPVPPPGSPAMAAKPPAEPGQGGDALTGPYIKPQTGFLKTITDVARGIAEGLPGQAPTPRSQNERFTQLGHAAGLALPNALGVSRSFFGSKPLTATEQATKVAEEAASVRRAMPERALSESLGRATHVSGIATQSIPSIKPKPIEPLKPFDYGTAEDIGPKAAAKPFDYGTVEKDVENIVRPPQGKTGSFIKDQVGRLGEYITSKLPADYRVWKVHPNSPVVSLNARTKEEVTQALKKYGEMPAWHKSDNPAAWMEQEEAAAVRMQNGQPFDEAIKAYSPENRQVVEAIRKQYEVEQKYAKYLRAEEIPTEKYYTIPHVTVQDMKDVQHLTRRMTGMDKDYAETLGVFAKPRTHMTMQQGVDKAGIQYVDPRKAALLRLWAGQKLISTGRFIEGLEESGVLFRHEAQAMSTYGKAVRVTGVPGAQEWWARSKSEAQFIVDNMRDPKVGGFLANISAVGNNWIRTPGLFNPLPHMTKNIGYKYFMSGGNPTKLVKYGKEFVEGTNPELLTQFRKYMPYDPKGAGSHEIYGDIMGHIEGRSPLGAARRIVQWPANKSRAFLFGTGDNVYRYSRWRQYMDKGFGAQEAANQTFLDLVNYGVRSEAVDIWKAMPLNFFVPWRTGSAYSVFKSVRNHPVQAALWIGGFDLAREELYRGTGWYFHAPIDYFEVPLVKSLTSAGGLASALFDTTTQGPGGGAWAEFMFRLAEAKHTGKIGKPLLDKLAWGFTSLFDQYGMREEFGLWEQTGDMKHWANIFMMATMAAHKASEVAPRRMLEGVPDSVWPKAQRVQDWESEQQSRQERSERRDQRRIDRPYQSIREKVGG